MARITAENLVSQSQSEGRIITAPWTWGLGNDLICTAEDYVETGDSERTIEYWGEDECGEWRVHLVGSVSEDDIRELEVAAEAAGDLAQFELCQRALIGGEPAALDACCSAIQAARAMRDD